MRVPGLLLLLLLAACGGGLPVIDDAGADAAVTVDAGVHDDAGAVTDAGGVPDAGDAGDEGGPDGGPAGVDAGAVDAGAADAGPHVTLVTVNAPRELRAVWVASVSNLDWPRSQTLRGDAGVASLAQLVDDLAGLGINALFFQVRPEADALYESQLEPWSRFLTGTQGTDPGFDPLAELLRLAHARGLEVHAWLNPYRASINAASATAANHVTHTLSQYVITYNGAKVLNPGAPAVRQHVEDVIRDLLDHYDVDGLHFDDYFYPYPDANQTPFPDATTFAGYQADGGTLSKPDWRRENVNALVREVMGIVTSDHPQVRFGVGPFGIWKSGQPVPGLDAYSVISCDAPTWMQNGWVDYLAPQLYWLTGSAQDFDTLATWWAMRNAGGRHLFPGLATFDVDPGQKNWPISEIEHQVEYTRTLAGFGAQGTVHFRSAFLVNNPKGIGDLLRDTLYVKPAIAPELPRVGASVTPPVPLVTLAGQTLTASSPQPQLVRFYGLYRSLGGGQWELTRVQGGPQADFAVAAGTWAVSAIGRGGAESRGASLEVP